MFLLNPPFPFPPRSRSANGPGEHAVMIPPLGKTALVWGLFLGVSANIRYQVCKRVPCLELPSALFTLFLTLL